MSSLDKCIIQPALLTKAVMAGRAVPHLEERMEGNLEAVGKTGYCFRRDGPGRRANSRSTILDTL